MTLRRPKLGNTYTTDVGTVELRTLAGNLIQGTYGLFVEKFSVTFDALDKATCDYLLDFLESSLGEEISITDHEGFTWTGFLVGDNPEVRQEGKGCNYSCSFTFEGNKE